MTTRLFGIFVFLETFVFLARGDRWAVLFFFTQETWLLVTLLWLKDLALAAAAGFAASRLLALVVHGAQCEEREPLPPLGPRAEGVWVVSILSAGAVLRWTFLSWNPPGLWVDAVYAARPLFGGRSVPFWGATPFDENPATHEVVSNLYVAFVRGVFGVFGSGETGFFAISAVPACLALLAFWWLAREAFGARTAVVTALVASLLGWPLLVGRWTTTASLLLALVLLGAAAALRALRTGGLAAASVAGVCVGLSLHTHAAAGAVAAGFAAFALFAAREPRARRLVAAASAAAALAFAPLAWAFVGGPSPFGGHLRDVHLATPVKAADAPRASGLLRVPAALAANAVDYGGVLLWTRDPNVRHAAGGPIVSPFVGAAALLGMGLAAVRRRPADVLLLCLAAGSLFAGVLSNPGGAPNTLRVVALLGPAAVLVAAVCETAFAACARVGLASWGILAAGLAGFLVAAETLPALVRFPEARGVAAAFCASETEAGRLLARLAKAPVLIEDGAVRYPAVVEAVAHGAHREVSLRAYPRSTSALLLASPPSEPIWFLASPGGLAHLAAGGIRVGRGVAPNEFDQRVVLARVAPARPRG